AKAGGHGVARQPVVLVPLPAITEQPLLQHGVDRLDERWAQRRVERWSENGRAASSTIFLRFAVFEARLPVHDVQRHARGVLAARRERHGVADALLALAGDAP